MDRTYGGGAVDRTRARRDEKNKGRGEYWLLKGDKGAKGREGKGERERGGLTRPVERSISRSFMFTIEVECF